ncbi:MULTISPECIES: FtsX-like permease family protein [Agrobacterium]|uniref:ABC transporter permease n=1 Tax=Agrobacterium tumefaciens TaxID=358 RepID=A0AAE6EHH7_AGRTU|nr:MULTISPECIES: FtsX-like permease family protein [Agrobacterium]QCL76997.1 ABC transporter permease [Agrobacterium tumefaciens]QCL82504.1 ABC transporter permease [Agrobacterium tumefaciens]CUX70961.1 ABC transporter, membrane spanning protein [Agrobacterium sp. NCPPB 925]
MNRAAFWALLSHWRYRPLQFFTLILGVALATALWSAVQAINAEARASYDRAASVLAQNQLDQLVAKDGGTISLKTYARLRRAGLDVSPIIEGEHRFGTTRIRLVGIDPLTMPSEGTVLPASEPSGLIDFMTVPGMMIVSPATASTLKDTADLAVRTAANIPDRAAFVDISTADRVLERNGNLSRIVISPSQKVDLQAFATIAPELTVKQAGGRPDVARLTDSFHLNLTAFGFLAFVVGLFIVYSATGLSFEQRRGTFRTLRSLGISLRALTTMLVVEITLFSLLSGALGVALGYVVASALLPGVAMTLRGLYGASVAGSLSIRPEWWLAGLGIAVVGTGLSSLQHLWRVWRMPLLSAAQSRAWTMASAKGLVFQAITGIVLVLTSGLLVRFGGGLLSGFAVLAAFLLGAAFVLPPLLAVAMKAGEQTSRHVLTRWFFADTRQQLPGLSLALMALLLALSANIGVGTMVSSFRQTFLGWLDQRLAAEVYVTARDEAEAARLRQWFPENARAVLPIWSTRGEISGGQVQIFGVADDPTYRDHWPLILGTAATWDDIASGHGALVNEQLWRAGKASPGQKIDLPGGWSATVVGVFSDYGNPMGQVIIGIDALVRHYPDVEKLRYGLRMGPDDVADFRRRLIDEFSLPEANIVDQASLKRQSAAIFEQTFAVTGALNVLTLAVAGFAMFSSLLTLASLRLPQLAPVWALGLRRRDLALLEFLRTLALWFVTFVTAIPVGLALAWVLLAIINVEAFGWRLPMILFPLEWLKLGLVALFAAVVSVLIPVRRLAKTAPADLLKVFANER